MLREPVLYPRIYPWFFGLAGLDVVLTWCILALGGSEANLFAKRLIDTGGMGAVILLKLLSVAVVVLVCEYVGRRRMVVGRRLAGCAALINLVPVVVALLVFGELATLKIAPPQLVWTAAVESLHPAGLGVISDDPAGSSAATD